MEKKRTWIIIGLLVLAISLYFWWKKRKEVAVATDVPDLSAQNIDKTLTTDSNIIAPVVSKFPLKFGSRNDEVKKVQIWLLKNEGAQIKVDGIWGKETDAAVKKFLKKDSIEEGQYKSMIKY